MKRLALTLACLLLPSMAAAQERIDARRLSCGQVAATVQARGAVVISTGAYTYDRYVSSGQFCAYGDMTVPAWIGTADSPQCLVGFACRDRPPRFSR